MSARFWLLAVIAMLALLGVGVLLRVLIVVLTRD